MVLSTFATFMHFYAEMQQPLFALQLQFGKSLHSKTEVAVHILCLGHTNLILATHRPQYIG